MPEGQLQPPSAHPDDAPLVCLQVNQEWLAYLIGMVYPARYPEYWGGTLEENRQARKDTMTLMAMLQEAEDCGMAQVCCEPQIYILRVNPDTGRPERSIPGSDVWTPDPTDPLFDIRPLPPIVRDTEDGTKCDASTNALEHIEDLITATSENIGTAITVFELAVAVAGFLLEVFLIVLTGGAASPAALEIAGLIWAAATAAFVEGKTAFDDYWTNDNKDKILCALFENIGADGTFTPTQYEDFKHQVYADLPPSPALDMVMTSLNAGGYQGLNQMASYGSAAGADCSGCTTPPCDVEQWEIAPAGADHGVITNTTSNTMTIEAHTAAGDSNYYAIIHNFTGVCRIIGAEITEGSFTGDGHSNGYSGTDKSTDGYTPGVPTNIYGMSLFEGLDCLQTYQVSSATPFTILFTFEGCG